MLGIDNLNEYYDVALKEARLAELRRFSGFSFAKLDVADRDAILAVVERDKELRRKRDADPAKRNGSKNGA